MSRRFPTLSNAAPSDHAHEHGALEQRGGFGLTPSLEPPTREPDIERRLRESYRREIRRAGRVERWLWWLNAAAVVFFIFAVIASR